MVNMIKCRVLNFFCDTEYWVSQCGYKLLDIWNVLLGFMAGRVSRKQSGAIIWAYMMRNSHDPDLSFKDALSMADEESIGLEPSDLIGKTYKQAECLLDSAWMVYHERPDDDYLEDDTDCYACEDRGCVQCRPRDFITGIVNRL